MNENTSTVNAVATRTAAPPVARSAKADVRDLLMNYKSAIAAALPKHLSADRMLRVALTAVNQTPKLLGCKRETLIQSILQASALGLEPGMLGHCYLIPYGDAVTLQVGYKGFIDLARRSGQVLDLWSSVVFEGETFAIDLGLNRNLTHVPKPPSERGKKMIGVYAVAKLKDGSVHFEFLWAEEVERIRKASRNSDRGPWVDWTEEMWKKTAIKRLVKYLPISIEIQRAAATDDASEMGLPPVPDVDVEFKVEDERPPAETMTQAFAQIAEKPAEKAPEPPQAQPVADVNDTLASKRERTAQALARKGFKGAKVLQFIGATIGTATQVDTLTGPECDRVLEALA